MTKFRPVSIALLALLLTSCAEDDNYVVVTRHKVALSVLPELSEISWRQSDFDFFIVSEAYAKVVPEADWAGPIGEMLSLVVRDREGNLPEEWDLPIDDRCLYVGIDRRRPSWRFQHESRTLFFIPFRVTPLDETQAMRAGDYLAVLDESKDLRRYDIPISSRDIRFLVSESRLSFVERVGNRLLLRDVRYDGHDVVVESPSELVNSSDRIERWSAELDSDGAIHVAWSYREDASGRRYPVFYSRFDGEVLTERDAIRLTRSSAGADIKLASSSSGLFVAWLDARFESGFVGRQNMSKFFVAEMRNDASSIEQPVVLNRPFDASDIATDPTFVATGNDRLIILWSAALTGDLRSSELRFSVLDYEDRSLTVARALVEGKSISVAAAKRMRQAQRANPVGQLPGPPDEECDRWQEKVRALPLLEAGPIDIHGRPIPLIEGSIPLIDEGDVQPDDS